MSWQFFCDLWVGIKNCPSSWGRGKLYRCRWPPLLVSFHQRFFKMGRILSRRIISVDRRRKNVNKDRCDHLLRVGVKRGVCQYPFFGSVESLSFVLWNRNQRWVVLLIYIWAWEKVKICGFMFYRLFLRVMKNLYVLDKWNFLLCLVE